MSGKDLTQITPDYLDRLNPYVYTYGNYAQMSLFPNLVAKSRGAVVETAFDKNFLALRRPSADVNESFNDLPIQARVSFEYTNIQLETLTTNKLDDFDREVVDAVASLYTKPGEFIDFQDIYRVIIGKNRKYAVTPNQIQMVKDSIFKCQYTSIKIQVLDLYEKDSPIRKSLQEKGYTKKCEQDYLIPCRILEYEESEQGEKSGIYLLKELPLFRYAKDFRLVSVFPLGLMDTPLSKTRKNIILQSYIVRAIDRMYRNKNDESVPKFIPTSAVYELMEKPDAQDSVKARDRKKIEVLLAFWKKVGYIKDYSIVQNQRRKVVAYRIDLVEGKPRVWDLPEAYGLLPKQESGMVSETLSLPG